MANEAGEDGLGDLSPKWRGAFDWIERELGGRIVSARRQARWRPAWFLELERDGEIVPLYFRGERGELSNGGAALEFEAGILKRLEAEGIPVPHVHAFCPEPGGIVMDRSPGQANLATAASEEERSAVLLDYMEILARMHAIDAARFDGLGLVVAEGEEALGLGDFAQWESKYRAMKARPEPEIEFLVQWIHRNVPRGRTRACFVCADAGQFLFDASRVTALIDFELAYVGDPAADLGSLRCRDLSEPLGPLKPAVAHYESLVGEKIDPAVIDYHTVRFSTCTPMTTAPLVARHTPGLDFVQYLTWTLVYARTPIEVIAEGMGLTLDAVPEPAWTPTRQAPAFDALVARLGTAPEDETEFAAYEREAALRSAEYLRRADAMGPEIEQLNIEDVAALTGERPADAAAADAALEAFVTKASASEDARLLPVLHRRLMRQEWLIEPVMKELRGVRMQSSR